MDNIKISEAELELMKVLWKADEPLSTQQVSDMLNNKDWKYSTIATLFSRMVKKGAVTSEKQGRFFYFTPTISEKEYKKYQTKNFISSLYNNSVKNLVVSLFENKQISDEEIKEIKHLFDLEE